MRIKQSFVTNSSSASYTVFIPENIDPEKAMEEVYSDLNTWYPDSVHWMNKEVKENSFKEKSISIIEELMECGSGYYDLENDDCHSHFPVLDWLFEKGYVLSSDVGGTTQISIENIGTYSEKILEILLTEDQPT